MSMSSPDVEEITDFQISVLGVEASLDRIWKWIASGERRRWFACANPYSLELARKDGLFTRALKGADLLTADGAGILLASRILGGRIQERVTGSDIFAGLCRRMDQSDFRRAFFLGSTEQTLAKLRVKMAQAYPRIEIVGEYSPPYLEEFSAEKTERMIEAVNRAAPDVLWVGMTAPKQEKWVFQNRRLLDVKFIAPVGAVFDFFAGNVQRSGPRFQRYGLEWLPRLIQEPRRLWRRTAVYAPLFLWHVVRQKFAGKEK
jgi:N-acetylglucosaminyldiphosphoundecaprenol N-acetyl-beta-D-mannosaminyltransferase